MRHLYKYAQDNSVSLLAAIEAAAEGHVARVEHGKVLVAVAGNGHSSQWALPEDFGPIDAVEMISELNDRYDEALAWLIAEGDATPTDGEIRDEMMKVLRPVHSVAADFVDLRCDPVDEDDD